MHARASVPLAAWLAALAALCACGGEPRWLEVERVEPGHGADGTASIAINQAVTVYFSDLLDPYTVTRESFRILGPGGHPVSGGELEVRSRSVRFWPRAPMEPGLSDGSFRPGATYRLEVPGMPTSFAIRSRDGDALRRGFVRTFRVPTDPRELGLPTLFVPVGIGTEPLRLDVVAAGLPRMAADAGVLELRFTRPVYPPSVRPEAFRVWRILSGADEPEELRPVGARILSEPLPGSEHPGSGVRLEFAPAARISAADVLYLGLADGARALLDYRGRTIEALQLPIPIKVDPGRRVRMQDLDLDELGFERDPSAVQGFEVRGGRVAARAFVEAGSGAAGAFVAGPSTVVAPGRAFDRGDGTELPAAGPGLEFTTLDVPPGRVLRLQADVGGLVLRVCGDVHVRGRLVLEGTLRELPWKPGEDPSVEALARAAGALIVAGGDFVVAEGAEVVAESGAAGCPLVVVAGGQVRLHGPVPPGCGFALRAGAPFHGFAEAALQWRATLTPGTPSGAALEAAAWTGWIPLPSHADSIDLAVADPRDGVVAWLQVAPPHSIVPGRPLVELVTQPLSLPLAEPVAVERGAFFRIGLMGLVQGDVVPSVAGFALHER